MGRQRLLVNCYFRERTTTHNTGVAIFLRRENDSQVIVSFSMACLLGLLDAEVTTKHIVTGQTSKIGGDAVSILHCVDSFITRGKFGCYTYSDSYLANSSPIA